MNDTIRKAIIKTHMKTIPGMPGNHTASLRCIITALIIFTFTSISAPAREVRTLQSGWKFSKGHFEKAFEVKFDDSRWKQVTIPHDWAITGPFIPDGDGNTGKLPWKGEGWYRNTLDIPPRFKGQCIYLVFDGIMSSPEISSTANRPAAGIMATTPFTWISPGSSMLQRAEHHCHPCRYAQPRQQVVSRGGHFQEDTDDRREPGARRHLGIIHHHARCQPRPRGCEDHHHGYEQIGQSRATGSGLRTSFTALPGRRFPGNSSKEIFLPTEAPILKRPSR